MNGLLNEVESSHPILQDFLKKNLVRYIGWLDSTSLSMYEMESLLCFVYNLLYYGF